MIGWKTARRSTTVSERVPYRPDELLEVLERHGVRYVVIGGLAAELRGSPYITRDVDVTLSRDRANLRRLAAALRELNATLRIPEVEGPVEFPLDEHSFDGGTTWTFVTNQRVPRRCVASRWDSRVRRSAARSHKGTADGHTPGRRRKSGRRHPIEGGGWARKDRAVLPILRQVLERSRSKDRPGPEITF